MRLHFVWVGKTRDRRCAALVADYVERIGRFASCEVDELKEAPAGDERRVREVEGARLLSATARDDEWVLLDEAGEQMTSVGLSAFIGARRDSGTKRLGFVIGGFGGVSDEVRLRAPHQLSLSRLTLTHELARVVLAEQVYRAMTLLAGRPYHRF